MSLARVAAYLVLLVLVIGVLLNFTQLARKPEEGARQPPFRFSLLAFEASGKSPRVYVDPLEVVMRSNITISGGSITHGDRLLNETLPLSLSMPSSDRVDPKLYYTYYAYTIALGSRGLGSREYYLHALPTSADDRENLSRVGVTISVPEQVVVPSLRLARLSDKSWETVEEHLWVPGLRAYALVRVPRYVLTYAPTYRLEASWTTEQSGSLVVVGGVDVSYGYEAVDHVYELEGCGEVDVVEGGKTLKAVECTYGVHAVYRFAGEAVFYAGNESTRVPMDAMFAASGTGKHVVWCGEGGYFKGFGPLASAELVAYVESSFAGCDRVNETYYECYRVYYVSTAEVVKKVRTLELVRRSIKLTVVAEPYSGVKPSLEVVDTYGKRAERLPFGNHTVERSYAVWPWEEGRHHLAFYSEDSVEYPSGFELGLGVVDYRIEVVLNVTRRTWLGGVAVEFVRPALSCEWSSVCRVETVVRVEPVLLDPPEIDEGLPIDPELPRRFLEYLVIRYVHDTVDGLLPQYVPYRAAVKYAMLAQVPLSITKTCELESTAKLLEVLARGCGDPYARASLLAALTSFSTKSCLTFAPLVELGNRSSWVVFARLDTPPLWELDRWGYTTEGLVFTAPEVGLFVKAPAHLGTIKHYDWELPFFTHLS